MPDRLAMRAAGGELPGRATAIRPEYRDERQVVMAEYRQGDIVTLTSGHTATFGELVEPETLGQERKAVVYLHTSGLSVRSVVKVSEIRPRA